MENKKDILESITSVTKSLETGLELNNKSSVSQYYCDALNDKNINDVLGDADTYLITLVGFSEVGKSTFVASLYHTFMLKGEIDGYKIIDSDTFVGFERRAHVRNEVFKTSKRNIRTVTTEGQFLTLTLYKDGIKKKLIISDKAGEIYKNNYVDNLSDVQKDKGLINSKHILFFIDCSVLNNDDEYIDFDDKFQMLLSRMSSAKVFDIPKQFDILYNKIDTNNAEEKARLYQNNRKDFEEKLASGFSIKVAHTFETKSNDMNDKGMLEAFRYIVSQLDKEDYKECKEVNWVHTILKNK